MLRPLYSELHTDSYHSKFRCQRKNTCIAVARIKRLRIIVPTLCSKLVLIEVSRTTCGLHVNARRS